MKSYLVSHLSDKVLEQEMLTCDDRDRTNLADLLARLAEYDARKLYLPKGYLLKPHLTEENVGELVAAAAGRTRAEIERQLAERSPRPDVPCRIEALGPSPSLVLTADPLSPGTVEACAGQPASGQFESSAERLAPEPVMPSAPRRMEAPAPRAKVSPLSPGRFSVQFTMDQEMHDDLHYAQELLSHQIPSREITKVLHRGLQALIARLETAKFGATDKPRPGRRGSKDARYIPAHVRRAVTERDGGQCTFVSESGHRCSSRTRLELDHVVPVARGGEATVENLRQRCRAHNQYEAEQTFGAESMSHKRERARRAKVLPAQGDAEARAGAWRSAEAQQAAAREKAEAEAKARAAAKAKAEEVIPYLRKLGVPTDKARLAADQCAKDPDSSLEHRVRAALSYLAPAGPRRVGAAYASGSAS